ncbi:MAG: hypothetical protein HC884_13460 [Chloroflexaceae bacterium]|nr:hypothetical protein [Chloroflexaceae bacterium]
MLLPTEGEGAYAVEVALEHPDGLHYLGERGYVHTVPDEYRPARPASATQTAQDSTGDLSDLTGPALLEYLATATGGEVISGETWTPTSREPAEKAPGFSLQQTPFRDSSWPWFLSAALVVWLLEIAVQRRTSYR